MTNKKTYWACPHCFCTDVQVQVWAHANTGKVEDDAGGYSWCPQCGAGDGDTLGDGEQKYLELVDTLKPYKEPDGDQLGLWDWLIKWPGEEVRT